MDLDYEVIKQVAYSLADHYLCVYYVNVNSGRYIVVTGEARQEDKDSELPTEGENFFADALKNAPLFIHPDDLEIINNSITHILNENGELEPIKYRARRKDGTYVFLYTRGFILTDSNGEPEYFGGIICEL